MPPSLDHYKATLAVSSLDVTGSAGMALPPMCARDPNTRSMEQTGVSRIGDHGMLHVELKAGSWIWRSRSRVQEPRCRVPSHSPEIEYLTLVLRGCFVILVCTLGVDVAAV